MVLSADVELKAVDEAGAGKKPARKQWKVARRAMKPAEFPVLGCKMADAKP